MSNKITLKPIDYKTIDYPTLIVMEELYFKHHSTPDDLLCEELPDSNYLLIYLDEKVIGMTSYQKITPKLARTERTILYPEFRGKGYGSKSFKLLEKYLKEEGFTKMTSEVFTFNLPMIILKLKQGHLIEGLAKNHDKEGIHQYYMGKEI